MATQPLEVELTNLLGGDFKARVVARYCGFDGLGGSTLQTTGAQFGITAERVRQIVGEVVRRRRQIQSPAPVLSQAIAFVCERLPGSADDIERELQAAGLSDKAFRIEGVIRAAELLHQPTPFAITATQQSRLVHSLSPRSLDAIVQVARRAIEQRGIATVSAVAAELREAGAEGAPERLIVDVLLGAGDLHWLDAEHQWFWLSTVARNPITRRVRKILSIANPVRTCDLSARAAREYYRQSDAPAPDVLLELYRQLPGIRLVGDRVEADPPIDPREVLGDMEEALVAVLREHGGFMARAALAAECLQRGMNRSSIYSALTHSPVIVSHPDGNVGLVGQEAASAPTASATAARARSKYLHSKDRAHSISLRKWME